MDINASATTLLSDDVAATSRFYIEHLGFEPTVHLDWFVDLVHPQVPGHHLALVRHDHPSLPPGMTGRTPAGMYLAFVVADVDAEVRRLTEAQAGNVGRPEDMPWGQRRCFVAGPEQVTIELVQVTTPDPTWMADQGL